MQPVAARNFMRVMMAVPRCRGPTETRPVQERIGDVVGSDTQTHVMIGAAEETCSQRTISAFSDNKRRYPIGAALPSQWPVKTSDVQRACGYVPMRLEVADSMSASQRQRTRLQPPLAVLRNIHIRGILHANHGRQQQHARRVHRYHLFSDWRYHSQRIKEMRGS